MTRPFNMELFLSAVLTGSYATRQRHLRQAKLIQVEIFERWQIETPWPGGESMWLGFLSIAWLDDARRLSITTC